MPGVSQSLQRSRQQPRTNVPDPRVGDHIDLGRGPSVILEVHHALPDDAAGTLDWEIRHDPDRSQVGAGTLVLSGQTNTDSGQTTTPVSPIVIPAGDWVWIEVVAVSGSLGLWSLLPEVVN